MHLCVVSFKPCWQEPDGSWRSDGGFPLQIGALGALFDRVTIVIVRTRPQSGGLPLPADARVVALEPPEGADFARKVSVLMGLGYYIKTISAEIRRADVVHAPVPGDVAVLGMFLALLFRKRLIARYGSSWSLTPQTTWPQRLVRRSMQLWAGGRNVMLATGVGAAPPAPRMRWIFSTALTQSELAAIQPRLERGLSEPPRLVYVGRLSPEKGVIHLLRALARRREAGASSMPTLTILGDGPQRKELAHAATALGLDDIVVFRGHMNRVSLSAELQRADVCVQPSLTEGFSKAWLDAMAHGVPVLSSHVGAAASVIEGEGVRGWLVPPGDEAALAEALGRALDPALDWTALRRRCRTFVEGRTLEAWAREIGVICTEHWGGTLAGGKLRA